MTVRCVTDQSNTPWTSTVEPHHLGAGSGLVDKHQPRWVKHALLSNPASSSAAPTVYATRNICGSRCSHACSQRSEVAKNAHTTSRRPKQKSHSGVARHGTVFLPH